CDQVVLGCTHFPLLMSAFEAAIPGIGWVDSTAAICRRVATLWAEQMPDKVDPVRAAGPASHQFLYTEPKLSGPKDDGQRIAQLDVRWQAAMFSMGFERIERFD